MVYGLRCGKHEFFMVDRLMHVETRYGWRFWKKETLTLRYKDIARAEVTMDAPTSYIYIQFKNKADSHKFDFDVSESNTAKQICYRINERINRDVAQPKAKTPSAPSKGGLDRFFQGVALSYRQQIADSESLLHTTLKAQTFFSRLHFIYDTLLMMREQDMEPLYVSEKLNSLPKEGEDLLNAFIERTYAQLMSKLEGKTEKSQARMIDNYAFNMLDDFQMSSSFWNGSAGTPHYEGPLYTKNNVDFLREILSQITTLPEILLPLVPSKKYSAVRDDYDKTVIYLQTYFGNLPNPNGFNVKFDLSNMPIIQHETCDGYIYSYLFSEQNQELLLSDISQVNAALKKTQALCEELPATLFESELLAFEPYYDTRRWRTCNLALNTLTPTGKMPKYPYHARIEHRYSEPPFLVLDPAKLKQDYPPDIFGTIFYLENGKVGRCEIVISCKYEETYSIVIVLINGELAPSRIYRSLMSQPEVGKETIYKSS